MIIDSDILIDFARKEEKDVAFLEMALQKDIAQISSVSQMELIVGCRNKREQNALDHFIRRFKLIHLSPAISQNAVDLLNKYRCSHGLLIPDALIAATALLEDDSLATRNRRHFVFIDGLQLVDY